MKNKSMFLLISLITILIVTIGSSFAYLRTEQFSSRNNNIILSSLDVILLNDISNITIDNALPVSDSVGLTNPKVNFQIKNDAREIANYKISLTDVGVNSTIANKDIRYQLKRTKGNNSSEVFPIKNLDSTGLIDTGTILVNEIYSYELVLWIDINANTNGLTFSKNILVEGMQVSSLDTSGANHPELLDNMLPVYYDENNSVWRVADSKNLNSEYKWYDYNNFMWANAVTVNKSAMSNYYGTGDVAIRGGFGSQLGQEVNMNDITSMWVWIPRFNYTIFNANSIVVPEQLVDIVFEHGIDVSGTVICENNILTSNSSSSSETCQDTQNNEITNRKSTYTHPAFNFNNEELTGFWFAKFEMGEGNNSNLLIKPGENSYVNQNLANLFTKVRSMELNNNIYGFKQAQNATLNTDGTILNDNNKYDIHLVKNMEWGAVSILSQSKYGKFGNNMYTGVNKRIYKNNYGFKTGYSGNSETAGNSTTNTVLYNNLTIQQNGQGYSGAGASTTGTIYGIYDMNGGAEEFVMGNIVNSSGNFSSASSGFTSLNSRYYDKYSYNTSSEKVSSSKLGDMIKESINWGGNTTRTMPQSDRPWFVRGGYASNNTYSGIYYTSNTSATNSISITSRPVLVISRDMPWLQ